MKTVKKSWLDHPMSTTGTTWRSFIRMALFLIIVLPTLMVVLLKFFIFDPILAHRPVVDVHQQAIDHEIARRREILKRVHGIE